MKRLATSLLTCTALLLLYSCKKESTPITTEAKLIFRFQFDSTQARLNNTGQPAAMPAGNAGQSPVFNKMSAHYIELAPGMFTALGKGTVLYKAPETAAGGGTAIDFEKSVAKGNQEIFYEVPLKNVTPGEYEWLRLSLAYQNYDVTFYIDTTISGRTIKQEFTGTLASFIGYNTYIKSHMIKSQAITVNGNRKQGFWGFETSLNYGGVNYPYTTSGQAPEGAPEGATTVVNPPVCHLACTARLLRGDSRLCTWQTKDHRYGDERYCCAGKPFHQQEL